MGTLKRKASNAKHLWESYKSKHIESGALHWDIGNRCIGALEPLEHCPFIHFHKTSIKAFLYHHIFIELVMNGLFLLSCQLCELLLAALSL